MNTEIETEEQRIIAIVGSAALAKSIMDPFDYALRLSSGEIIRYTSAKLISDTWIHLYPNPQDDIFPYKADRGMDIRISEIVWVMDAPEGS